MSFNKSQLAMVALASLALGACGRNHQPTDGETTDGGTTDGGGVLQPFTSPGNAGPKQFLVTASGEKFGIEGYAFPPSAGQQVAFVDGWEVRYDRVLITFDKITFSANPDKVSTDQSQTGAAVAQVTGPWAVNLAREGTVTNDDGDKVIAIAVVANQNLAGNAAFSDTDRYAFGFDTTSATHSAKNVNLDPADIEEYRKMIAAGQTLLLQGTATFKGGTTCTTASGAPAYDFSVLPQTMTFRFAFKSPTTYVNCQNPSLGTAGALGSDEFIRGVQIKANEAVQAQATFHLDHPFWDALIEDSPLRWDPIAAQYIGMANPEAKLEDFAALSFSPFKDKNNATFPFRSCIPGIDAPAGNVSNNPNGVPVTNVKDYMTYNQSTFGHLNADGLCFPKRNE